MTNTMNNINRTRFSIWMQAIRPFSYTATATPILIGAMAALLYFDGVIDWFLLPFVLFGGIFLHVGGNLLSEFYDYKYKIDDQHTYGGSRILVENLLQPKEIKKAAYLSFVIGVLMGLVAIIVRGDLILLWIGLIGLLSGYLYGANPLKMKYIALGDLAIFLAFGPLMVLGSYYALTGSLNNNIILIALPISFLVIAILHANNTRDIKHDTEAGIKTVAILINVKGSILYYYALVFGAYIGVIAMVFFKILPYWSLLTLISLPPAIKNAKIMRNADREKPENILNLDVTTAQHHMLFGVILSISLLIEAIF